MCKLVNDFYNVIIINVITYELKKLKTENFNS